MRPIPDPCDAFVALPGGYGTLDETFEILTWAQLGIHTKPVGLLNVGGFFDPLLAWARRAEGEGFIQGGHVGLLDVGTDAEGLLEVLQGHEPSPPVTRWADREDR